MSFLFLFHRGIRETEGRGSYFFDRLLYLNRKGRKRKFFLKKIKEKVGKGENEKEGLLTFAGHDKTLFIQLLFEAELTMTG